MSELFTVKVDLSAVTKDDSNHQFYILLVDTKKTKMIYEFKLWVRFLFSLECLIELVHDNAVIHDLEDIQILSLLQTVKVIPVQSAAEEQVQQKNLLSRLKKYNEMYKDLSPGLVGENQEFLLPSQVTCLFNRSEALNITNSVNRGEKAESLELANLNQEMDSYKNFHTNETQNLNTPQSNMKCSLIQEKEEVNHICNDVNFVDQRKEGYGKLNISSDKDDEPVKFSSTFGKTLVDSDSKGPASPKNVDSSKSPVKKIPASDNLYNGSTVKKNKQTAPRKQFEKPFSVSHFLTLLRGEASFSENENKAEVKETKPVAALEQQFCEAKFEEPEYLCEVNGTETGQVAEKKARKRIRKHKSKKKDLVEIKQPYESVGSYQSFYNEGILKQSPENVKPKHIRFDGYDEEFEKKEVNNINSDKISESNFDELLNGKTQLMNIDELKDLIDEKKRSLKSVSKQVEEINGYDNSNSKPHGKFVQDEMCSEDKSIIKNENGLKIGQTSASDDKVDISNFCEVLDALGNMRKQNKEPVIFKRFV